VFLVEDGTWDWQPHSQHYADYVPDGVRILTGIDELPRRFGAILRQAAGA